MVTLIEIEVNKIFYSIKSILVLYTKGGLFPGHKDRECGLL